MKIALTNVPAEKAHSIAATLVKERAVACVNLHPIKSYYVWKDELHEDEEVTLIMKVAAEGVTHLRVRLLELHPYELMEFIVHDINRSDSLPEYVEFVRQGTRIAKSSD
jgi:periplasmic divalent cation tolerance protein